jgi:hypothetical protein
VSISQEVRLTPPSTTEEMFLQKVNITTVHALLTDTVKLFTLSNFVLQQVRQTSDNDGYLLSYLAHMEALRCKDRQLDTCRRPENRKRKIDENMSHFNVNNYHYLVCYSPRMVTGEKNSPTVAMHVVKGD